MDESLRLIAISYVLIFFIIPSDCRALMVESWSENNTSENMNGELLLNPKLGLLNRMARSVNLMSRLWNHVRSLNHVRITAVKCMSSEPR